ncbi:Rrf2 family transcriptional regulator [Capsulimonas corticalis]|uniref:Rrf2 family transcriptional regulator n=1 Tax=Capsulimonas corticalis TaxID=2219043 RepID=A0A402CP36_9BACT|nr:Rrf2 family transcriptional regulator [Capsulimonas corticalis]BDI33134.1 Rrf2 family transcriptional regulator [Capsulimonas corticalis]
MLALSKKADYALNALLYLAHVEEGRAVTMKEIAAQLDAPTELLAKVLQSLARAGILTAMHGKFGGYRLAQEPCDISVIRVMETIDGPLAIASCLRNDGVPCVQMRKCRIRQPMANINARIREVLADITVKQMCTDCGEREAREPSAPDEN